MFKPGESAPLFYPDLQICSAPANLKWSRRENWDRAADYKTLKKYLTKYRYRTFLLLIQNKVLIYFAELFCIRIFGERSKVHPFWRTRSLPVISALESMKTCQSKLWLIEMEYSDIGPGSRLLCRFETALLRDRNF